MSNTITTMTAAALILAQLGVAAAALPAAPGVGPAPVDAAAAGFAGTVDAFAIPAPLAADAGRDAEVHLASFGIRVPGLKTVGRAMSALNPASRSSSEVEERRSSGPSRGGTVVRDHRTPPPLTRDHRRQHTVVPAERGRGAQERPRETLREESGASLEQAIRQSGGG